MTLGPAGGAHKDAGDDQVEAQHGISMPQSLHPPQGVREHESARLRRDSTPLWMGPLASPMLKPEESPPCPQFTALPSFSSLLH